MTPPLSTPAASPARRPGHASIALAVVVTCQLMVVLDATVVNIALPDIKTGLGFSATDLSWVLNAYTLAFGGLLLLGGRMGDVFGRRRMFISGVTLFTLASLVGGFAQSSVMLVAARAVQGVGAAIAAPSVLALITTNFAEGQARNKALGIFTAVSAGGGSIGLLLGGVLTDTVSWRWVLFINVPIGIAIVLLAPLYIDEPARGRARLDVVGALTSTAGMTTLAYGFIHAASGSWGDPVTIVALALGVSLLALFVAIEARVDEPLLPLRLFAARRQAAAYATMFLLPATMFGMFFFLSQFMQDVLGYSPLETGLAFLPLTVLLFGCSQIGRSGGGLGGGVGLAADRAAGRRLARPRDPRDRLRDGRRRPRLHQFARRPGRQHLHGVPGGLGLRPDRAGDGDRRHHLTGAAPGARS